MIINENTKIGETKADYISVNLYLIRSIELSYPNNFQKKKKKKLQKFFWHQTVYHRSRFYNYRFEIFELITRIPIFV